MSSAEVALCRSAPTRRRRRAPTTSNRDQQRPSRQQPHVHVESGCAFPRRRPRPRRARLTTTTAPTTMTAPPPTTTTSAPPATTTTSAPPTTTSTTARPTAESIGPFASLAEVAAVAVGTPIVFLPLKGAAYGACLGAIKPCVDPDFNLVLLPGRTTSLTWAAVDPATAPPLGVLVDTPSLKPVGTTPADPLQTTFLMPTSASRVARWWICRALLRWRCAGRAGRQQPSFVPSRSLPATEVILMRRPTRRWLRPWFARAAHRCCWWPLRWSSLRIRRPCAVGALRHPSTVRMGGERRAFTGARRGHAPPPRTPPR